MQISIAIHIQPNQTKPKQALSSTYRLTITIHTYHILPGGTFVQLED
jgi:hypothetical protein